MEELVALFDAESGGIESDGTLDIHSDDDSLMVEDLRGPPSTPRVARYLSFPVSTPADPDALSFSDDEDDETSDPEPESVFSQHWNLTRYLRRTCADVDMLILHNYDLAVMTTHFPFNLVQLESQIFRHRGYTERAEKMAQGVHHVIQHSALFIGTLNYFQILIEDITAERVDSIKEYFVTQLALDKSLYQGFVSPNVKRGVVSSKGCVITVTAFLRLCFGAGIHRISLGRFGQKTPWSLYAFFEANVVQHCEKVSIDVAFNFPVPQNDQVQDCIPVFCYANNPSRSNLMFHRLGQKLLNQKVVNWGWVRLLNQLKFLNNYSV